MLPSPSDKKIGVLDWVFEAQYPARECLCLRFSPNLTIRTARLKVRMACYSFPAGLFHSLQHAGLSRRTVCPFSPMADKGVINSLACEAYEKGGCPGRGTRYMNWVEHISLAEVIVIRLGGLILISIFIGKAIAHELKRGK
jgi:hypothetical protein